MRMHVTLNTNEDGAFLQQIQQAYPQTAYPQYADCEQVQQQQQTQFPQPQQHFVPQPQQHYFVPQPQQTAQFQQQPQCQWDNQQTICQPPMQMARRNSSSYEGESSQSTFYGGGDSSASHQGSSQDDEVRSQLSSHHGDARSASQGSYPATHHSHSHSHISTPVKTVRPIGTQPQMRGHVDPSRFKTEPCSYWVQGQACPYAPQCAFAHGESDKRSRRRNVREGVTKVNTLPRTLVYHEAWVQTTKYTRKTGPSGPSQGAMGFSPSAAPAAAAVPAPSFKRSAPQS